MNSEDTLLFTLLSFNAVFTATLN